MWRIFRHRTSGSILLVLMAMSAALVGGCGSDSPTKNADPGPEYLPYDSPDNLIGNLVLAFEAMDLAEYRDSILYDGVMLATDGEACAPFTFYYDRNVGDPQLPDEDDSYERELGRVARMFAGLPGNGVPGIKSFDIDLSPYAPWQVVPGGEAEDDLAPEDARQCVMSTYFLITLKANIEGTDFAALLINDRAIFICIPTGSPDAPHWRLWKWRDVVGFRVENSTFGGVKALYPPAPKAR